MTTPDLTTFRSRLFDCLCSRGWTQTQLARASDVSRPTIAGYLSGKRYPTLIHAMLLADALEVSLDWLCGREDSL